MSKGGDPTCSPARQTRRGERYPLVTERHAVEDRLALVDRRLKTPAGVGRSAIRMTVAPTESGKSERIAETVREEELRGGKQSLSSVIPRTVDHKLRRPVEVGHASGPSPWTTGDPANRARTPSNLPRGGGRPRRLDSRQQLLPLSRARRRITARDDDRAELRARSVRSRIEGRQERPARTRPRARLCSSM